MRLRRELARSGRKGIFYKEAATFSAKEQETDLPFKLNANLFEYLFLCVCKAVPKMSLQWLLLQIQIRQVRICLSKEFFCRAKNVF